MRKMIRAEWFAVLAGLSILVYSLFTEPFIGVADNGDFLRVMGTVGLNYGLPDESYEDRFFGYAHRYFSYDRFFQGFYPSTQIILVAAARLIGSVRDPSSFDIRVLGALFSVLLLAATYIIVRYNTYKSSAVGVALAICMLFVFFDIGYAAYFNSLFGEPVSFVFLLLSAGFGLCLLNREKPSRTIIWLYFVSVFFLACSKIQNAPAGILFAALGLRFMTLRHEPNWRRLTIGLSASIAVVSVVMYAAAPKGLKNINLYQTVFYGILHGSPDIDGDLKELGLPSHLSVLAGTNYFQTDTAIKQDAPSMKPDFYDRVSHRDILLFYVKHPSRLIDKMEFAASNSMSIRPYYLGNYLKQENKPSGAMAYGYSVWSEFKHTQMPRSLLFISAFYAIYYAVAIFEYIRRRDRISRIRTELMMLIGLVGAIGFLMPILGDGQADIGKHLFLFNVCFDMMLVVSVIWLVYQLAHWSARASGRAGGDARAVRS
ncbi:glycan biosynthesis hexose transferase WsfD [Paenibacillus sp. GYB003]|uniref:glycan biosynthesis hexose transferase WsfD n=1 Tax=Paenibacillus sp. GYB003 TaxID=2994392 RepID=UPI002F969A9A